MLYEVITVLKLLLSRHESINMIDTALRVFCVFYSPGRNSKKYNCANGTNALKDRITSYNVCYTKLLRAVFGDTEPVVDGPVARAAVQSCRRANRLGIDASSTASR